MSVISYLLPTKRDQKYVDRVIQSINNQPSKYDKEICIFSQNKIEGENVRWFHEPELKGPIYGFNYLAYHCTGDYMMCMVDDHELVTPIDGAVDLLTNPIFSNRKYHICSICTGPGPSPIPGRNKRMGSIFHIQEDFDLESQSITLRFPFLSRDCFEKLDKYIFHPEFRYHAGDIYLGYYLGMMGEPATECYSAMIRQFEHCKSYSHEVVDCNTAYCLMKNIQSGRRDYVEPEHPLYHRCDFRKNKEVYEW